MACPSRIVRVAATAGISGPQPAHLDIEACCHSSQAIVVGAKAGIGYHGVASLIPPSDLPTLSVVGEGEVTISIKH